MFIRRLWRWLRTDRKRQIFHYWDGRSVRRIDPMVAWMRLVEHPEFVEEKHIPAADRAEPEAVRIVCRAVSDAFDVPELTDSADGLTISERLDLLTNYYDYLTALKKNIEPPAISSSPTGSDSLVGESTTNAASDSGLTGSEPKTGEAPESSGLSETPLEPDSAAEQPLGSGTMP